MKRLHVQIQPARSRQLDGALAVARLSNLRADARVTEGEDKVLFINIDYNVADLPEMWASVRNELSDIPGLAESSIVVCEGQNGWDDYLLLHHFDPAESVDAVE
jgi:hypothetical protein